MSAQQALCVAVGHSSLTGPRERNEDFCGVATPQGAELAAKGVLAVVADGVGGHRGGREASESVVRGLLSDYYGTPDTWSVPKALDTVLNALNRWVLAQASRRSELAGMATTLTALVVCGRRYCLAHVGDSRLYRLRDGRLEQLTSDHLWEHPELKNVLSRAVGLDAHILVDYGDGELAVGDRFLLLSDGVWGVLDDQRLKQGLLTQPDAQQAAGALTSLALAEGGADNATALVLDILELPPASLRDSLAAGGHLPLPPRLRQGQVIDGRIVESVLHDARETLLYQVRDLQSGQRLVLKTLQAEQAGNRALETALLLEEWRARRVVSPFFPQVVPSPERSALYFLQTWHAGSTLQQMLTAGHHFGVAEVVQHGIRLLKGVAALHRLDIAHRDLKPDNLHLGLDGRLRILDLGVATSAGERHDDSEADTQVVATPGTPSYMAPELFSGTPATAGHDLYAAGVTLYQLLTRHYPYGEVEPFSHPRFGEVAPASRWRPEIPAWLDHLLLKAVTLDPAQRFETAEEFLLALERGPSRMLAAPVRVPLAARNPLRTWKLVAATSLLLNVLLLTLWLG